MAKLLGGCGPDRFKDPGPRAGPLDSCDTAPGGGGGVSAPSAAQQQLGQPGILSSHMCSRAAWGACRGVRGRLVRGAAGGGV